MPASLTRGSSACSRPGREAVSSAKTAAFRNASAPRMERATKSPADFHASHYDPTAKSSAKIEIVNGKILYTAVASASSQNAAVLADEQNSYRVSYEIAAAITPDGELKDFEFRQLGAATRELN